MSWGGVSSPLYLQFFVWSLTATGSQEVHSSHWAQSAQSPRSKTIFRSYYVTGPFLSSIRLYLRVKSIQDSRWFPDQPEHDTIFASVFELHTWTYSVHAWHEETRFKSFEDISITADTRWYFSKEMLHKLLQDTMQNRKSSINNNVIMQLLCFTKCNINFM